MKNYIGTFLFILTVLCNYCNAAALRDIYGTKLTFEAKLYKSYWFCNITDGAKLVSSTDWVKIGPEHLITNPIYGVAAFGQSKRHLPVYKSGKLPIHIMQLYDLLKPLHAAASVCCVKKCEVEPGKTYNLLAKSFLYEATVFCEHDKTKETATAKVGFVGDNPWCKCSGDEPREEHVKYAYCEIPCLDEYDDWWCDQINYALENCDTRPKWVLDALPPDPVLMSRRQ